jgi:hypothetical protein
VKWVRVHSPHSLAGLYWSQDTPTVVHQNQWFRSAWRAQRCVCVWGGGVASGPHLRTGLPVGFRTSGPFGFATQRKSRAEPWVEPRFEPLSQPATRASTEPTHKLSRMPRRLLGRTLRVLAGSHHASLLRACVGAWAVHLMPHLASDSFYFRIFLQISAFFAFKFNFNYYFQLSLITVIKLSFECA